MWNNWHWHSFIKEQYDLSVGRLQTCQRDMSSVVILENSRIDIYLWQSSSGSVPPFLPSPCCYFFFFFFSKQLSFQVSSFTFYKLNLFLLQVKPLMNPVERLRSVSSLKLYFKQLWEYVYGNNLILNHFMLCIAIWDKSWFSWWQHVFTALSRCDALERKMCFWQKTRG